MIKTFEQIYREHRQGMFTLALSITGRPDRAEDAVQEGFARLFRLQAKPTGDPVAYAFAAVRNAAVDQKRRNKEPQPVAEVIFLGQASEEAGPTQLVLDDERDRVVRQVLDCLSADQRETVVLKVYGGLTFEQIAQTLDLPLGTVASRYRRALEKMKDKLECFIREQV